MHNAALSSSNALNIVAPFLLSRLLLLLNLYYHAGPADAMATASFANSSDGLAVHLCGYCSYSDLTEIDPSAFWADCLRISNWTLEHAGTYTWDSGVSSSADDASDGGGGGGGDTLALGKWVHIRSEGSCALLMRYNGPASSPTTDTPPSRASLSAANATATRGTARLGNQDVTSLVLHAVEGFGVESGGRTVEVWGNLTCGGGGGSGGDGDADGKQGGGAGEEGEEDEQPTVINWWLRNSSNLEVLNGEAPSRGVERVVLEL
ncbi:hypothetical protein F4779DRAFT_165257 [Xylariaceae sp. FL0662B]|nr:hypothetical protein F4779DRAFT_165257 [Xylariaceae sp. FL0662B]